MKRFYIFLKNRMKLSLRDMNMPIFAIIMPLVILAILGVLYGGRPAAEGASYTALEQSFGALCAIAICAGGLMACPKRWPVTGSAGYPSAFGSRRSARRLFWGWTWLCTWSIAPCRS